MLGHDWANAEATMRSYRLFAREVAPHFKHQVSAPTVSHDWATKKRGELFGRAGQAMLNAITSHVEEPRGGKAAGDAGESRLLIRAAALKCLPRHLHGDLTVPGNDVAGEDHDRAETRREHERSTELWQGSPTQRRQARYRAQP